MIAVQSFGKMNGLKLIAIKLLIAFTATQISWAVKPSFAEVTSTVNHSSPAVSCALSEGVFSNLAIESKFGRTQKIFCGDQNKTLIHIQDAHANYEAQKNIAALIGHFVSKCGVKLVAVEGTSGVINTAFLSGFPDKKIREAVSDFYLRKAKLSGAEYYSIAEARPFILYGIESAGLYEANRRAFIDAVQSSPGDLRILKELRDRMEELAARIFPEKLRVLLKGKGRFGENPQRLIGYADQLIRTAEELGLSLGNLKCLEAFRKMRKLEQRIDFEAASREMIALTEEIGGRVEDDEAFRLSSWVDEYAREKIVRPECRDYLEKKIQERHLGGNKFGNAVKVLKFSKYSEECESGIFRELGLLEKEVRRKLSRSGDEEELNGLFDRLEILERLFNLSLEKEDALRYFSERSSFRPEVFANAITGMLQRKGLRVANALPPDFSKIAGDAGKIEKFYKLAIRRDNALLDNTIAKMEAMNESVAVIVTGGFHSAGIQKKLEKKGYSYLVISPRMSRTTNKNTEGKLYRESVIQKPEEGESVFCENYLSNHSAELRDPRFQLAAQSLVQFPPWEISSATRPALAFTLFLTEVFNGLGRFDGKNGETVRHSWADGAMAVMRSANASLRELEETGRDMELFLKSLCPSDARQERVDCGRQRVLLIESGSSQGKNRRFLWMVSDDKISDKIKNKLLSPAALGLARPRWKEITNLSIPFSDNKMRYVRFCETDGETLDAALTGQGFVPAVPSARSHQFQEFEAAPSDRFCFMRDCFPGFEEAFRRFEGDFLTAADPESITLAAAALWFISNGQFKRPGSGNSSWSRNPLLLAMNDASGAFRGWRANLNRASRPEDRLRLEEGVKNSIQRLNSVFHSQVASMGSGLQISAEDEFRETLCAKIERLQKEGTWNGDEEAYALVASSLGNEEETVRRVSLPKPEERDVTEGEAQDARESHPDEMASHRDLNSETSPIPMEEFMTPAVKTEEYLAEWGAILEKRTLGEDDISTILNLVKGFINVNTLSVRLLNEAKPVSLYCQKAFGLFNQTLEKIRFGMTSRERGGDFEGTCMKAQELVRFGKYLSLLMLALDFAVNLKMMTGYIFPKTSRAERWKIMPMLRLLWGMGPEFSYCRRNLVGEGRLENGRLFPRFLPPSIPRWHRVSAFDKVVRRGNEIDPHLYPAAEEVKKQLMRKIVELGEGNVENVGSESQWFGRKFFARLIPLILAFKPLCSLFEANSPLRNLWLQKGASAALTTALTGVAKGLPLGIGLSWGISWGFLLWGRAQITNRYHGRLKLCRRFERFFSAPEEQDGNTAEGHRETEMLVTEYDKTLKALDKEMADRSTDAIVIVTDSDDRLKELETAMEAVRGNLVRNDVPIVFLKNERPGSGMAFLEAQHYLESPEFEELADQCPHLQGKKRVVVLLAGGPKFKAMMSPLPYPPRRKTESALTVLQLNLINGYKATQQFQEKASSDPVEKVFVNGGEVYLGPAYLREGITLYGAWASIRQIIDSEMGFLLFRAARESRVVHFFEDYPFYRSENGNGNEGDEENDYTIPKSLEREIRGGVYDIHNENKRQFLAFAGILTVHFDHARNRRAFNDLLEEVYQWIMQQPKESLPAIRLSADILVPLVMRAAKKKRTVKKYLLLREQPSQEWKAFYEKLFSFYLGRQIPWDFHASVPYAQEASYARGDSDSIKLPPELLRLAAVIGERNRNGVSKRRNGTVELAVSTVMSGSSASGAAVTSAIRTARAEAGSGRNEALIGDLRSQMTERINGVSREIECVRETITGIPEDVAPQEILTRTESLEAELTRLICDGEAAIRAEIQKCREAGASSDEINHFTSEMRERLQSAIGNKGAEEKGHASSLGSEPAGFDPERPLLDAESAAGNLIREVRAQVMARRVELSKGRIKTIIDDLVSQTAQSGNEGGHSPEELVRVVLAGSAEIDEEAERFNHPALNSYYETLRRFADERKAVFNEAFRALPCQKTAVEDVEGKLGENPPVLETKRPRIELKSSFLRKATRVLLWTILSAGVLTLVYYLCTHFGIHFHVSHPAAAPFHFDLRLINSNHFLEQWRQHWSSLTQGYGHTMGSEMLTVKGQHLNLHQIAADILRRLPPGYVSGNPAPWQVINDPDKLAEIIRQFNLTAGNTNMGSEIWVPLTETAKLNSFPVAKAMTALESHLPLAGALLVLMLGLFSHAGISRLKEGKKKAGSDKATGNEGEGPSVMEDAVPSVVSTKGDEALSERAGPLKTRSSAVPGKSRAQLRMAGRREKIGEFLRGNQGKGFSVKEIYENLFQAGENPADAAPSLSTLRRDLNFLAGKGLLLKKESRNSTARKIYVYSFASPEAQSLGCDSHELALKIAEALEGLQALRAGVDADTLDEGQSFDAMDAAFFNSSRRLARSALVVDYQSRLVDVKRLCDIKYLKQILNDVPDQIVIVAGMDLSASQIRSIDSSLPLPYRQKIRLTSKPVEEILPALRAQMPAANGCVVVAHSRSETGVFSGTGDGVYEMHYDSSNRILGNTGLARVFALKVIAGKLALYGGDAARLWKQQEDLDLRLSSSRIVDVNESNLLAHVLLVLQAEREASASFAKAA